MRNLFLVAALLFASSALADGYKSPMEKAGEAAREAVIRPSSSAYVTSRDRGASGADGWSNHCQRNPSTRQRPPGC